uniref:Uncharacterized protein n=1 Tax=Anguilla anguilla TaxID=7936 RepID=A0A0E9PP75_ANGAN
MGTCNVSISRRIRTYSIFFVFFIKVCMYSYALEQRHLLNHRM